GRRDGQQSFRDTPAEKFRQRGSSSKRGDAFQRVLAISREQLRSTALSFGQGPPERACGRANAVQGRACGSMRKSCPCTSRRRCSKGDCFGGPPQPRLGTSDRSSGVVANENIR